MSGRALERWTVFIPENVLADLFAQDLAVLDLVTLRERLGPLASVLEESGGLPLGAFRVLTATPECLGVVVDRMVALYRPVRTWPWWRRFWPWATSRCALHVLWLTVLPHRGDSPSAR